MAKSSSKKANYLVGVDLGGTKILAAVLDREGHILSREKKKSRVERGPSEVIHRILRCVESAIDQAGIKKSEVLALGIGSPGPLNPVTGVVEAPCNLPGWINVPLKTIMEQHLGFRVFLDNDVNVGTYGEYRMGAGVGIPNLVGIFIGTGIGGGLILNGQLYEGFNHVAGELGHVVIQADGPPCNCGRKGCYEALASRLHVTRRIGEMSAELEKPSLALELAEEDTANIRSSILKEAWQREDPVTRKALTAMADHTGLQIANLMNLLNPERFILGGGVIEALGDELLPIIDAKARAEAFPHAARNVSIVPAMLGDDAGIVGAAFLALERAGG